MSLIKNLIRLAIEAALGILIAAVISMLTMAALFTWADQVNPPFADLFWEVLPPIAVVVADVRFILRAQNTRVPVSTPSAP